MWIKPHINWDGKLLGCSSNIWGSYAKRVFDSDLVEQFNNEKMQYCRDMLMDKKPLREDIPCIKRSNYRDLLETGNWLTESEIYGSTRD